MLAGIDAWIQADGNQVVAEAQFQSARLQLIAQFQGDGSTLPADANPELRQLWTLPPAQYFDRLLGHWEVAGREVSFMRGLANLTEREAEVVGLSLDGKKSWEIASAMQPTKRRGTAPAIASVEGWLCDGRRKLRRLLEVPPLATGGGRGSQGLRPPADDSSDDRSEQIPADA